MAKKEIIGEDGKTYTVKEKKPFYKKPWFIILVGLVILGGLFGGKNKVKDDNIATNQEQGTVQAETEQVEETISISAVDLVSAYEANEVAADKQYKGKMLSVSGSIYSIAVTLGTPQITLHGADGTFVTVIANMSTDEGMDTLSKGQEIAITGKCDGSNGLSVNLLDAKLN